MSVTGGGLAVRCEGLRLEYALPDDVPADGGPGVVRALDGVTFDLAAGSSVAVVGPSGSGKSTLLSVLAGLVRPTHGRVLVGEHDISRMSERELLALRANGIGVVLQNPARNLLSYGTVEDNLRFAQRGVHRDRRGQLPAPDALLERLGLGHFLRRHVGQLSGGEQQRVGVAIGLAAAPGLLLADEPTSQLDAENREHVVVLLSRAAVEVGTTVLAVTHDADVAAALDRTLTIEAGRIVP